MDRHNETLDGMVKRVFGPEARLAGSIGTVKRPGDVRIVVARRVLGIGRTFSEALQAAQRTAAGDVAANQTTGV